MTIAQGKISLDERGCAYSPEFGDVYASKDGAYKQSRFVFWVGTNCLRGGKASLNSQLLRTGSASAQTF